MAHPYDFQARRFSGLHLHHGNSFGLGHVFFRFGASGLQELAEAEEFAVDVAILSISLATIAQRAIAGVGNE